MKSAAFWVLLIITVALLCLAGALHFDRALRRRMHIGEATIRLGTNGTVLSDEVVTRIVSLAMVSNSIASSNWRFVPSLSGAPSIASRNLSDSNSVTVLLTNVGMHDSSKRKMPRRLIANIKLTNGLAHVNLSRPK